MPKFSTARLAPLDAPVFTGDARGVTPPDAIGDASIATTEWVTLHAVGGGGAVANPTATIGLSVVNGAASSAIRSDGAPALSQAIVPTWTGFHQFNGGLNGPVTATGSTTPRALEERFADTTNVKDFGASPIASGAANITAFQAAIDSTADGTLAVIHVPSGTYAGVLTTLVTGTRTIMWQEEGEVTYSGGAPPGYREYTKYAGDVTRPWYYGHRGITYDQTTGLTTDRPLLRVQRAANHTGGSTSSNNGAVSIETIVNQTGGRIDNFETALNIAVTSYRADTAIGNPNLTAVLGASFKQNPSTGVTFGANFVARDQTTRKSSISVGGMTACELDCVASGPDDTGNRTICELIARGYDVSADGATSIACGLRIRPADIGVVTPEPCELVTALEIDAGLLGSISNGIVINNSNTWGIYLDNFAAANAHIEVFADNTVAGTFKLGCRRQTNGVQVAGIDFNGWNSSNAKIAYGQITVTEGNVAAGAENGSMLLRTRRAGVNTAELTLNGGMTSVFGLTAFNATAIPAGGTAGTGYKFSSTSNFGVFFGSGVPSISAARGSLYLRSDGTTTNDRAYINTNGGTTWTALTTVA